MPMGSVLLKPGVNTERSLSLNEAGISVSQLLRFKDGLVQTLGGWQQFGVAVIPSTVRDLHAWQGVTGTDYLGVGATSNLIVATANSNTDITPQKTTTNPVLNFSISSGSANVTVVDANSGPSVYNTVFFNTPVSIGNILLNGAYPITSVLSTGSYVITSSVVASTTIASSGKLPTFTTTANSPTILVNLSNNNFPSNVALQVSFYAPTSVGGLTVSGPYIVTSIIDSTTFDITATTQATSAATQTMNSTLAQLVYYVTIGPQPSGSGFGSGGFGSGGFGSGSAVSGTPGTPITATDWSLDNWGEILLACPKDGPIYTWSPNSGFQNAQVIASAPFFNGGIFVSMPQQILVAWKTTQSTGTQDNLEIRWSNSLDYADWTATSANTAGSFHIPSGSVLMGALQSANYAMLWSDIEAWLMQYVGGEVIFNFSKVGVGCGLIGQHAAGIMAGEIFWCSKSNFFHYGNNGTQVLPCSVWDYIFQNINTSVANKVRCAPNSAFNEIAWFFPSGTSTENNAYVKYNTIDQTWDFGLMQRTAWIDVSVLGNPIAVDTSGTMWQHEMGANQTGTPVTSFQSGWWALTEGNDIAFVDYVIPDFIWGTYGNSTANVNITFYTVNYPGDNPSIYGPYTVTQQTQYLTPRMRGRLMSVLVQSDNQSFWRLGRIRFRYAVSGRR